MKAFIAHSPRDRQLVADLATLLREGGHQVFVAGEMTSGEDLLAEMSAAIRSADILIAVLTAGNPNVLYELGLAAGASVPTLIAGSPGELLPTDLVSTPYVQLSGDTTRDVQNIARRAMELTALSPSRLKHFRSAEEALQAATSDPSILESLSPTDFERLIVDLLRERGYSVTSEESHFPSADFLIEAGDEKGPILVEVKKGSRQSRISVDTVRRFLSRVTGAGKRGMLIATSDYTAAALEIAVQTPVILRTLDQVLASRTREELLETGTQGLASSLIGLATTWARKGEFHRAIEYYERAAALQETLGDRAGLAAAYGGVATALVGTAEFHRAIEYYERAAAIHESLGDRAGLAAAYGGIATALARSAELRRAIEYYERAAALHESLGDRAGSAAAYGGIAAASARSGEFHRAIQYYERAAALHESTGDQARLAATYGGIASALAESGGLDDAIEYYERAAALQQKLGDRYRLAASLAGTAAAWLKKGHFDKAIEDYERAAAIQRDLNDRYHLSLTLNGLARAAAKAGRIQMAESCTQEIARLGVGRP